MRDPRASLWDAASCNLRVSCVANCIWHCMYNDSIHTYRELFTLWICLNMFVFHKQFSSADIRTNTWLNSNVAPSTCMIK